ncbi:unnamed protein product [Malus baccata var. baccata]
MFHSRNTPLRPLKKQSNSRSSLNPLTHVSDSGSSFYFRPWVWGVTEWYQSHSTVWCKCADEDVGPLRGAFWELTRFGFHRNSKVKRVWARGILGWMPPWEVAREFPETKQ